MYSTKTAYSPPCIHHAHPCPGTQRLHTGKTQGPGWLLVVPGPSPGRGGLVFREHRNMFRYTWEDSVHTKNHAHPCPGTQRLHTGKTQGPGWLLVVPVRSPGRGGLVFGGASEHVPLYVGRFGAHQKPCPPMSRHPAPPIQERRRARVAAGCTGAFTWARWVGFLLHRDMFRNEFPGSLSRPGAFQAFDEGKDYAVSVLEYPPHIPFKGHTGSCLF